MNFFVQFLSENLINSWILISEIELSENGKLRSFDLFTQPKVFFLKTTGTKLVILYWFSCLKSSTADSRVFFYPYCFLIIAVICFIISSILKSFGVNTAFTPKDMSFFSSIGGIIPPTTTGILW